MMEVYVDDNLDVCRARTKPRAALGDVTNTTPVKQPLRRLRRGADGKLNDGGKGKLNDGGKATRGNVIEGAATLAQVVRSPMQERCTPAKGLGRMCLPAPSPLSVAKYNAAEDPTMAMEQSPLVRNNMRNVRCVVENDDAEEEATASVPEERGEELVTLQRKLENCTMSPVDNSFSTLRAALVKYTRPEAAKEAALTREEWIAQDEEEHRLQAVQAARLKTLKAVWDKGQKSETALHGKQMALEEAKQAKCNQKALAKAFSRWKKECSEEKARRLKEEQREAAKVARVRAISQKETQDKETKAAAKAAEQAAKAQMGALKKQEQDLAKAAAKAAREQAAAEKAALAEAEKAEAKAHRERLAAAARNAKLAAKATAAARRERLRDEKYQEQAAAKALAQKEKEQKALERAAQKAEKQCAAEQKRGGARRRKDDLEEVDQDELARLIAEAMNQ